MGVCFSDLYVVFQWSNCCDVLSGSVRALAPLQSPKSRYSESSNHTHGPYTTRSDKQMVFT